MLTSGRVGEKLNIYRAVEARKNTATKLYEFRRTMRPPGNVPYFVDNLWEWKRPDGFPCRRFSVYASPAPELAKELGRQGSPAFRVKIDGRFILAQVQGYKDAKEHPDRRKLRDLILNRLGQGWLDGGMREKENAGRLWLPCLRKDEVESLFTEVEALKSIRNEIWEAITFWDDVVLIREGAPVPDPIGEFFFEAEGGYRLEPIQ